MHKLSTIARAAVLFSAGIILLFSHSAYAHEVYVLDPGAISMDVNASSPNPFSVVAKDENQFALWAFICIVTVLAVFFISISRRAEKKLFPLLLRLKKWAPLAARLTLGFSLFASAYYSALFGPELPFANIFHNYSAFVRITLFAISAMITLGIFTRIASLLALIVYGWAIIYYQIYMLTYLNYFGEMVINIILGSGIYSLDSLLRKKSFQRAESFRKAAKPYGFAALRICFGIAVIFASWYAKFVHSQLALDTVVRYHLTNYFHFEPLFVVLGAFIIEALIGIFFIAGFEIRFTAIFFLTFLTLSLLYFGELVWPHLVLLGVNLTFLLYGYDRLSIEGRFLKKGEFEPVL